MPREIRSPVSLRKIRLPRYAADSVDEGKRGGWNVESDRCDGRGCGAAFLGRGRRQILGGMRF